MEPASIYDKIDPTQPTSERSLKQLFETQANLDDTRSRGFLLDNFVGEPKAKPQRGVGSNTAKKFFAVPEAERLYTNYLPLKALWLDYIHELLGPNPSAQTIAAKLVKADLHGADIAVYKAKCDGYVGQQGIVIQETRRALRVIRPDNQVKSKDYPALLKQDAVFMVPLGKFTALLYGEHLQYQPEERARVKFKQRDCIRMLYN